MDANRAGVELTALTAARQTGLTGYDLGVRRSPRRIERVRGNGSRCGQND